jgi:hypothetical protein
MILNTYITIPPICGTISIVPFAWQNIRGGVQ